MNVINFPLTKTDDIYQSILDLDIQDIYSNIGIIGDEKLLSAYLRRIYEYEKNTIYLIDKFRPNISEIKNNFILNEYAKLSKFDINSSSDIDIEKFFKNSIDVNSKFSYMDVYGKDTGFINDINGRYSISEKIYNEINNIHITMNVRCVLLTHNNYYLGHTYAWYEDNNISTLKVMGIRVSILNYYLSKFNLGIKGSSYLIFDSIIKYSIYMNSKRVIVVQPLSSMSKILGNIGFTPFMYDYIYIVDKYINKNLDYKFRIIDVVN